MKLTTAILLLVTTLAIAGEPRAIDYQGVLGIPARLVDGRLISMIADARPFNEIQQEGGELAAYRRLSIDHGATWSAPEKVFSYAAGKGTVVPQMFTLVDRNGSVHTFNVRYYELPNRNRSAGRAELLHAVSKDSGKTWSLPTKVNFGKEFTGAINSIVQLKSGRILGALSYTADFLDSVNQREFRICTFYSDDLGETWHPAQDNIRVPFGPQVVHPGAIEPILLEMAPNQVQMMIRTQTLRFYEAVSTDGGKSFSTPKASRFMAPDSPGAWLRLGNNWIVFVWNDIQSYPNGVSGHYRQYLYAAVSKDNGRTWSKSKRVAPVFDADKPNSRGEYPFLCGAKDGSVILFYTRFGVRHSASYEKQHNELVRLDPAWLLN